MTLDHLIVPVNDAKASVGFYESVLGFHYEGEDGPFSVVRVSPDLMLLLSAHGTKGGGHYAFRLSREEFDVVFSRLRDRQIPYGDAYDTVGSMKGPGRERSARGEGSSVYFWDPNQHLLEIVGYER
ncbi:MAG TPA: VOC family protein [Polyangiaceae bacterium]|nr:VOC family protein [Polyangiaceae bacterium]